VTKLNIAGSALIYSTYLGGSGSESPYGIAVDGSGNAYVTGQTVSTDFPTTNPLQSAYGGSQDAFVTQLNTAGSALIYSTYLGGSDVDFAYGIAVDGGGNAYVTGLTTSTDFPTTNPLQSAYGGGDADAFVVKISGTLEAMSTKLYFAQFGNGQGLTSEMLLTNSSASSITVSGTVDFFDDNGLPLEVGIVGPGMTTTVDFSIYPLGAVTISTDGFGEVTVGSAVVSSLGTLGGVVRFDISGIGIAGVAASQPLSRFITPVRRELGGINTGIAIHNAEARAVTLDITLRDMQGRVVSKWYENYLRFSRGRTFGPIHRRCR
jgi:hypothetical protein